MSLQYLEKNATATSERLVALNDGAAPFFGIQADVDVLDDGSYTPGKVAGHGWSPEGKWYYRVQCGGTKSKTV